MQNVLFLCTGNSGRSLMAEALLRHWSDGMFTAFSAGSHPVGQPKPVVLELLEVRGVPTHGLRSKSWDEFGNPHAPAMDLVITVCDRVAEEACPVLPGSPLRLHWGLPDPSAAQGDEAAVREAFATVCDKLEKRIAQLQANLERWRWLPRNMGFRYIIVNAAGYELEVVEDLIASPVKEEIELQVKFKGYIDRQNEQVARFKKMESVLLPQNIDYRSLSGLSNEVVEKLTKIQPLSLGQASRISGITPAAVSVLQVHLKKIQKQQ